MPRQKRSIHYVYKTTNLINNRYYIGKHSTYSLEDGYLGSGKRLRYEIDKYGRENFKKEILEFFDTSASALEKEKQIVDEELLNDPLCLNIQIGGEGGGPPGGFWNDEHREKFTQGGKENLKLGNRALGKKLESDPEYRQKFGKAVSDGHKTSVENGTFVPSFLGKKHTEETKQQMSEAGKKRIGEKNSMYGKTQSLETKKKISDKLKGRKYVHGTCWITNGIESCMVKKEGLILPEGWRFGRTCNYLTEKTKEKFRMINRNSRWMNDGINNKRVSVDELDFYLGSGWKFGMFKCDS